MTNPRGAERPLRLGTRGSKLALWQAEAVAAALQSHGGPPCDITVVKTSGDLLQDKPASAGPGKHSFVKELEEALLHGEIDLAVHSVKDMAAVLPPELILAAVLPREDPRDVVVLRHSLGPSRQSDAPADRSFQEVLAVLGDRPRIGTASVRRAAQLSQHLPLALFQPIRGNLDTRLRKLDSGNHDALILAAAGLRRLGFGGRISAIIPETVCVPAPGQGVIGIQARRDEADVLSWLERVNDRLTFVVVGAERAVVEALGAGCQTPLGVLATFDGDCVRVRATMMVANRLISADEAGPVEDAASIAMRVARALQNGGA